MIEDSIPENCIILSPEKLAKLGVNIKQRQLSTYTENGKQEDVAECNSGSYSGSENSQSPVIKRERRMSTSEKDGCTSGENNALESSKSDQTKNDVVEASRDLLQNVSNFHSNASLMDDLDGKFKDAESAKNSEMSTQTPNIAVPKRRRGRPKKSLLNHSKNVLTDDEFKIKYELPNNEQKGEPFSERLNESEKHKPRTGKGKKNYKISDDYRFNNESNNDSALNTSWRMKTKNLKKEFENHISSSNNESQQKYSKIEASDLQADNNTSLEMENETLIYEENKTPKKRGRPKKMSVEGNKVHPCTLDDTGMSESVLTTSKRGRKRKELDYSILENPDFFEVENGIKAAPFKRDKEPRKSEKIEKSVIATSKRGRKRKELGGSPLENPDFLEHADSTTAVPFEKIIITKESEETEESAVAISKRGRKRKELDYSIFENPDLLERDDSTDSVPFKKNTSNEKRYKSKRTFSEIPIKKEAEYRDTLPEVNFDVDDLQYLSKQPVSKRKNIKCSNSDGEEKEEKDHSELIEPNVDDSANKQGSSRYKWTGNVTKAINQMFNAIKENSLTDLGDNDPLAGKHKRSAKRKDDADHLLVEEGSSVCMVCNETIPNQQWLKHKTKVHYNLTWRKGDFPLDLSNQEFVLKTFKQLIELYGCIECNRCLAKIKNAKKFVSHLDVCNGVIKSCGSVTCAVCKTEMGKGSWPSHNYRQHNNLAWREGDPPLNLEDQDLVMRILNALYKARKPLHCEKCGLQKKSVLGYLSHKTICQKTEQELEKVKVECHICYKKVLPVSMDYHLKTHGEREARSTPSRSDYFDVNVDVIGKRKAATQALQVISSLTGHTHEETTYYSSQCDFQDSFATDVLRKKILQHSPVKCIFNCDYSADVVETIANHMDSCDKKPVQYFICKICLSWNKEESDMHEHIKSEHKKIFKGSQDLEFKSEGDGNSSEEDEVLDEEEKLKKRLRSQGKHKINVANARGVKPIFLVHPMREYKQSLLYRQAYVWMLEFCENNYNKSNLYQVLRNSRSWQVLDCDILNAYLPKNLQSCDIAARVIQAGENRNNLDELNFRKLQLFEVCDLYEGDTTIYCGGPVSALAWLPTPYNQKSHNQVLAIAVFNSMESYYEVDKNFCEPYVIQFWDFGMLNCHQKNLSKPLFLYGMALTCGPIWDLEWCPSGCVDCFQEVKTLRLGLLAVAASDSFVYVYSIDNLLDDNDRGLIYKGEPALKLQLEFDKSSFEGQSYYPTKISWSKAAGHRYIAVGYSTGLVALYDLLNESLLLRRGDPNGTCVIFPYHCFQAHFSSITALTLSHLSGGNRFLFTASFDRTSLFWDLSTTTKILPYKKNTTADGVWMTMWPAYLVVEDESTFNEKLRASTYYKALRNVMCFPEATKFTYAASGIKSLCYSDWLNTILHGSNGGEVMAQFTHRMFCNLESKRFKVSYRKCLFSLTKLVKKACASSDLAITSDEATSKYKVVFMDFDLTNVDNTPSSNTKNQLKSEELSACDIRECSLQSINKVVFNPNPQACSFYAVGYQAGFVRLQWIKFLSPLLSEH